MKILLLKFCTIFHLTKTSKCLVFSEPKRGVGVTDFSPKCKNNISVFLIKTQNNFMLQKTNFSPHQNQQIHSLFPSKKGGLGDRPSPNQKNITSVSLIKTQKSSHFSKIAILRSNKQQIPSISKTKRGGAGDLFPNFSNDLISEFPQQKFKIISSISPLFFSC